VSLESPESRLAHIPMDRALPNVMYAIMLATCIRDIPLQGFST